MSDPNEDVRIDQLQAGQPAPDFTLPGDDGPVALSNLRGHWVVLYFYPADFTAGCTREACDFRDALAAGSLDATVIGVSPDSIESHERFGAEHRLGFPLLADEDQRVAKAYGAWGNKGVFGWGVKRSTFIIDPEGLIAAAIYNVRTEGHAAEVAERLTELRG